jgi:putative toxin-antitoxin system antitoxin component (TIGR02293 family)
MTQVGNPSLLRYRKAKKGISPSKVTSVKERLQASDERMAKIVGVSRKTFITHASKKAFSPEEAERILRVEEILDLAKDLIGGPGQVRTWLMAPNRSLGGEKPFDLLVSPSGAEAVHDSLLRMRYGVFA